ncbi:MAG: agmatinase family protein [Thaumarchaeota archaeon]|nr:agmatinase family protein [Nitrososphaerota archaeon]
MRRPAEYPKARYHDPHDRRLAGVIRQASKGAANAVNLLGVPFDGAVLGRKGAAGGPGAIRAALMAFSNYNVELGIGLEGARVFDLGDVVVEGGEVTAAHKIVEDEVRANLDESSMMVVLGGDNSLSLPALRAYSQRFRKIGLVVVDSHLDLRGRIGGRPTSGSSYGLAIEALEGLDGKRVAEVGVHGFLNSKEYVMKAGELGASVFTADDVRRRGAREVAKEAYEIAAKGADGVYFSVDLDAVDLVHVSGVSAPSAGGMEARDLFEMALYFGGKRKVMCADIVELAPSLDPTGKSEVVAATALTYMVGGFLGRQGTKPKVGRAPRR